MPEDKLGWILIHSSDEFGPDLEDGYESPEAELAEEFEPGFLWHWRLPAPMKEGGPYTLLLSWNSEIFGHCTAEVTHEMTVPGYNFAFRLLSYTQHRPLRMDRLPLGNRLHQHRSIIKLDSEILRQYKELIASQSA